jgi:phosphohistidine phosphatase SixA
LTACSNDSSNQLLQELRSGNVVLYMRHAATDDVKEGPAKSYEDCSWQRNLNAKGKAQGQAIGEAVRALKLPVDTVLASPMCRTMETARLVFGKAQPEVVLRRGGGVRADGLLDVTPIVRMWEQPPPPGRITAIVGHENPEFGFKPLLEMGETAVMRPKGSSYELIGRVMPEQWSRWAGSTGK